MPLHLGGTPKHTDLCISFCTTLPNNPTQLVQWDLPRSSHVTPQSSPNCNLARTTPTTELDLHQPKVRITKCTCPCTTSTICCQHILSQIQRQIPTLEPKSKTLAKHGHNKKRIAESPFSIIISLSTHSLPIRVSQCVCTLPSYLATAQPTTTDRGHNNLATPHGVAPKG